MPGKTYSTKEIADLTGVHPNTVRLYEAWGFIAPAIRRENNYRVFTDEHLRQMKLARVALPGPYPLDGKIVQAMVKEFARKNTVGALVLAREYLSRVQSETVRAAEALVILDNWFEQKTGDRNQVVFTGRRSAAAGIGVSLDALRTWERNGLFSIARNEHGQLVFSQWDIEKIQVIRLLRNCGYSISSLLRVFADEENLKEKPSLLLSLPDNNADFFYVTDLFLEYLDQHIRRAELILTLIQTFEDDQQANARLQPR